jgi:hypothetical protein
LNSVIVRYPTEAHDSVLHILEAELDLEDLSVRQAMFAGIEYAPRVPIQLAVLAMAQMGVHLIFFLYISSAPGQANNSLALAFGIFVVGPHRLRLDDYHGQSQPRDGADRPADADAAVARSVQSARDRRGNYPPIRRAIPQMGG